MSIVDSCERMRACFFEKKKLVNEILEMEGCEYGPLLCIILLKIRAGMAQ